MTLMRVLMVGAALSLASPVLAQTAAPSPAGPAAPTTQAPAPAAPTTRAARPSRTAVSQACSAQANAKGLHGKARKSFRSACKRNGGDAG